MADSPFKGSGLKHVNMHEAKTHLSRLVDEAAAGQAFLICKAGQPLVRVSPLEEAATATPRRLGLLRGQCSVPEDFDQIAAESLADLFEGQGLET